MNNTIYDKLTALDFIIVAAYLVILLVIGYLVSVKQSKKNETLFMAGNSLNWYNIGFNMWGTNVGPSSLLAFASIGYTTGIVAGNFEWYAFVFLLLLAIVFAPKYIASKVSTMPEYMGKRYGDSTQTILAWYAMVKILVSWLSLGLFSGGVLVRQILGIPMWQSVTVLVIFSGIFTYAGGLKAIAKVNVFQMILLIVVSLTLSYLGLQKVGGIEALIAKTPSNFWNLVRPADDAHYPWPAILLGYPVAAVAFFCTDQSMVQSVLGAKNLEQGQLGVNFIGWLKVMALPLFILPGILCAVLYPELGSNSDLAYMTMVTNLFPSGMNGLVICVMIAVLVATIGSSLNALSTVFTNDIYVKKMNPAATIKDQIKVGRITIGVGCIVSILIAIAIDNIKGQNLFNIFQAVLGFLAPSLSVVFLLSIFWKRTTKRAVNWTLSWGSAFSLFVGVLYLWIFPADIYTAWPHFLLISFYIFVVLMMTAIVISLVDKNPETNFEIESEVPKTSKKVKLLFGLLGVTIVVLYLIFNFN